MSEKKQKGLVPRLHFPEFRDRGEWELKRLGVCLKYLQPTEYLVQSTTYDDKFQIPVLTAGKTFILGYTNETKGVFDKERLPVIIFDDFTTASKFVDFPFKAKSSAMKILLAQDNNINIKFIYEAMQRIRYEVGVHKRHWISIFSNFYTPIPKLKEQQKIADCLSSIDESISTQTEKLNALKNHKKALMQQLFPAEGETTPKLRFPEFRDGEEWDWGEVGNIYDVTRGYVLSMSIINEKYSEETPYPVYSSQTKNNGLAGYYNEYLYEDAITWTTDGANAGDVNYRNGKFYCTNVCGVLLNNKGFANLCMAELLNTVTRKHVSYVGNPKLMNGVMSKISIPFPKLEEQQKIADCLSFIDELIATQTEKIDMLRTHKKGLMQQLFPLSGEVSDFDLRNS